MIGEDLGRNWFLDVDASGAVTIRPKGVLELLQPSGGLPVFSTDTLEEAEQLRVLLCWRARDGSGVYFLNDPPKNVEDLSRVAALFRTYYLPEPAER
jgi:hypothetical protein